MSASDAYVDTETDDVRVPFLRGWRGGMDHFRRLDARELLGLVIDKPLVEWTELAERRAGPVVPRAGGKGWMAQPLALSKRPWIPEPDSRHWGKMK